jgi:ribosomal protein S14
MTKLKIINKHRKLNINFYKKEFFFKIYKSIYQNKNISFFLRQYVYYNYIQKFNFKNIKLFCIITGNSRSKYSFFNISRIKLRDLISYRTLVGIRKSS